MVAPVRSVLKCLYCLCSVNRSLIVVGRMYGTNTVLKYCIVVRKLSAVGNTNLGTSRPWDFEALRKGQSYCVKDNNCLKQIRSCFNTVPVRSEEVSKSLSLDLWHSEGTRSRSCSNQEIICDEVCVVQESPRRGVISSIVKLMALASFTIISLHLYAKRTNNKRSPSLK